MNLTCGLHLLASALSSLLYLHKTVHMPRSPSNFLSLENIFWFLQINLKVHLLWKRNLSWSSFCYAKISHILCYHRVALGMLSPWHLHVQMVISLLSPHETLVWACIAYKIDPETTLHTGSYREYPCDQHLWEIKGMARWDLQCSYHQDLDGATTDFMAGIDMQNCPSTKLVMRAFIAAPIRGHKMTIPKKAVWLWLKYFHSDDK